MENVFALIMGAVLILVVLTGFIALEGGFSRAKNAGSVMMKCLSGFCLAVLAFLLAGRYILWTGNERPADVLWETMAVAVMTAIFSGGVMERISFTAHTVSCLLLAGIVYPLILKGILLVPAGADFQDMKSFGLACLAGSGAAFGGARILGARIGKYTKGGVPHAMPGHNIPLSICGEILLAGGFALMACCVAGGQGADETQLLRAAENLILSASVSGTIVLLFTKLRYKKPDITVSAGGFLTGIVAVIPSCIYIGRSGVCILAVLTGFFSVLMIENMDRNMKVDDPAGLCSIFGVAGILGLLAVGVSSTKGGLAHGGGILLLAIQLLAGIWAFVFAGAATALVLWLLKKAGRSRLTAAEEIEGADISEYGIMSVYHDFAMNIDTTDWSDAYLEAQTDGRREEVAVHEPYVYPPVEESSQPLTKIEIIARKEKLENLKTALNDIGITGMTVFPVTGCGVQKGYNEFYRGVPVAVQLRAKIRVEVVVAKVPVDEVVNTVRRVLYTGHVGDGKIFIYTLDDVVRVRTGESGYDAMQGAASE